MVELHETALAEIADWKEKYRDLPMDLVNTSLLWVAEHTGITDILTIDLRDFSAYRLRTARRSSPLCSGVNQPPQPFGGGRCKIPATPSYFVRSVPDMICRLYLIANPLHPTLDF